MLNFASDYIETGHSEILKRLLGLGASKLPGYGGDEICENAKRLIKKEIDCESADVYFLVGGTQTNKTVISSFLSPCQGVISVKSGHINVHESGAIENSGHKVIALDGKGGKLLPETLKSYLAGFYGDETYPHMVQPGMVYISHPTEYGTLYKKSELSELYSLCREYGMKLYIDGARLGYGLMAETDVKMSDLPKLCDAFYIGGTKVGAMLGEALCIVKPIPHMFTMIKQQGALLAKGWLLGAQFEALFADGLYYKIAKKAIDNAMYLKEGLKDMGLKLYIDSPTNQQFVLLKNEQFEKLSKTVAAGVFEGYDAERSVVRFVTSWATEKDDVTRLLHEIKKITE